MRLYQGTALASGTGRQRGTLQEMAACAGLSERTFLRRFKAATGFRPTEYTQRLRVNQARELLELTQRSIEQIALDVGYHDAGAFRQVFYKVTGLSPRDYRERFAIHLADKIN
ncbi:helix-turn-helix domain-containing protein [Oxalobacter vibrioformis]|uniref:Helix-turn-helix domain-containing protein n=1 Tax=Oxalobacter vibrioformis TaxID=933080 RepID=A0A9E9P2N3_9BURK|nr:helix-turn-helix domain-containing protein [Oxalobacter vibrioformis]WAW09405.1 helix-turn-helix domain-containing protein [Oxalobacter vibrioformis]